MKWRGLLVWRRVIRLEEGYRQEESNQLEEGYKQEELLNWSRLEEGYWIGEGKRVMGLEGVIGLGGE